MWQRLYEEDEGWQEVTDEEAWYSLSKGYDNVNAVMAEIKAANGQATATGFALIRWIAK